MDNRIYRFSLSLVIAVSVLLCSDAGINFADAQETSKLAELQQKWDAINTQLDEKQVALETGDVTPGLSQEFGNLVEEANSLIGQMRDAAIGELSANPDSKETVRFLMGIMLNDASEGKDAEVLKAGDALIVAKASPKYFEFGAKSERLELSEKRVFEELLIRQREAIADDLPRIELETSKGKIILELFENEAPNTVNNFVSLVESGYYKDKLFHRVIEGFMAQCGGFEEIEIGSGSPGYKIKCECVTPDARPHFTGSLAMAHGGRDSGGSQFYITFARPETPPLDGKHTVFGRVISGSDVLQQIQLTEIQGQPLPKITHDKIVSAKVIRKRDHDYKPRKVGDPEPVATPPETPVLKKADEADKEPELKEESDESDKDDAESAKDETKKSEPKLDGNNTKAKTKSTSEDPATEKETLEKPESEKPTPESQAPEAEKSGESKKSEVGSPSK